MSTSSLGIGLIVLVVVAAVLLRRMRPQAVNPQRTVVMAAIFVLVLLFSLASTGERAIHDLLAIVIAPFTVAVGALAGWWLGRLMTFWTDPNTGQLWMRGGIVFAVIYMVTLLLRFGASYVANDQAVLTHYSWLAGISADLVFFSIGLWITRTVFILLRYRQHVSQGGAPYAFAGPQQVR